MPGSKKLNMGNKGFTLIEILIAMTISSIVVGIIYAYFSSSSRAYTAQSVSARVQQSIRVGVEYMVYDLRMAGFSPAADDGFGVEEADVSKVRFTMDSIDPTLVPPDYNGFIDDNDLERITYSYDPVNQQTLRIMNEGTASESQLPLLDNVQAFSFAYFDDDVNALGAPVAAANLGEIRSVEIALTVRELAGSDDPVSRSLTQRVNCRNMGL